MLQKRTSTKILCFLPSALTPALESCSWSTAEHIANNNLFMNLAPEFLSWIHRGVLPSNLKSRLTLPQPGTSTSQGEKKSQQPDILYQGKGSSAIYEERGEIKDLPREACKQQQSWDKSDLLAFRLGRNSEERIPADLNSFQLWARWWYTVGCSKERWWGLQAHQEAFALTHDTWHSNQTSSAHTLWEGIFWEFCMGKKKKRGGGTETPSLREMSLRFSVAFQKWPIKANVREVAVWPLSCRTLIHHHTTRTGNSLRSTSWHQSKQLYDQNIRQCI